MSNGNALRASGIEVGESLFIREVGLLIPILVECFSLL